MACAHTLDAVPLDGQCANDTDNHDDSYDTVVRLRGSGEPTLHVRSSPAWDLDDPSNVLGVVAVGSCTRAQGPLKNRALGNALGYAIRVRDPAGRVCRGYVAGTVVDDGSGV